VLSQFRTAVGRRPKDPRFTELVSALDAASPEFRVWWPEYQVRDFKPVTVAIDHPEAGQISLDIYQMHPVEQPDLLFVLQIPSTVDDLARVQRIQQRSAGD
jgi:hypothetical protein